MQFMPDRAGKAVQSPPPRFTNEARWVAVAKLVSRMKCRYKYLSVVAMRCARRAG